jgi:Dissimilatory sulfite reductase (desulfoviridin), alpha and beta subunits
MRKALANTDLCKGCLLCVGQCPKNAIQLSGDLNDSGYEVITVDEDKCIGCGFCYMMCPDYVFSIVEE